MLAQVDTIQRKISDKDFLSISHEIFQSLQASAKSQISLKEEPKGTPLRERPSVTIYTDGSWKDKTKTGAWCALMTYQNEWKLITCGQVETTINRMELSAVIEGQKCLKEPCEVLIISDSQQIVNIINQYIYIWPKKNFVSSKGTPVLNQDQIKELIELMKIHKVKAKWVKAHTGFKDELSRANDICDYFAQRSADTIGRTQEVKPTSQPSFTKQEKKKKKFEFFKKFILGKHKKK